MHYDTAILIRLTEEQKEALQEFIRRLNLKRVISGKGQIKLATWIRELALKRSGNKNLGAVATAVAAAKEMTEDI